MRAEDALALAKSYVKKSLAGAGALKGDKGDRGDDGFSPIVSIEKVGSETTISVTDSTHSSTATVLDGLDGVNGKDGKDGETPIVTIGGNGNWFINGIDTLVSAKGTKGDTGSGFSVTKTYASVEEMVSDSKPAKDSEVVVVITGDIGSFYLRLDSYVDPDGATDGYLPIGSASDISVIKGEKGDDGITPRIDPESKHWFIGENDTGILAEGKAGENGKTPYIGENKHWFIGDVDTEIVAEGKDGRSIQSITRNDNDDIIVTYSDGTSQNIGKLKVDIQADFLTSGGFGNLRYYNGAFQYYDSNTSTWVDTSATPENVYIMQMIPQAMQGIYGFYDIELQRNKLRWTEPDDTIIDGQVVCVVEKVIIRRKLNSAPADEKDGELVVEFSRSDFGRYITDYYVDESLEPTLGDKWFYKAFPVSTSGFVNTSVANERAIECRDYCLYGIKIDQNESDPASMITYLEDCDNFGFRPAKMDYSKDVFSYGDWESAWFIKDLKPCMLNYDGTVAYELDRNNYALKKDGTDSDIADTAFEGNAMIGFPKIYWKIVDNGDNTAFIYFANKKADDDFVCWSHIDNNGNEIDYCYMSIYQGSLIDSKLRSISGALVANSMTISQFIESASQNNVTDDEIWSLETYSDRNLVNMLLLLIGRSTDTHTVFGVGYVNGATKINHLAASGKKNDKGLFWGHANIKVASIVKVFGIENWWGNVWRTIVGKLLVDGNYRIKLTYGQSDGSTVDGYNIDATGYIQTEHSFSTKIPAGYIKQLGFDKYGLTITEVGGSATTYYVDRFWCDISGIMQCFCGGSCGDNFNEGALSEHVYYNNNNNNWNIGACICCKPLAV